MAYERAFEVKEGNGEDYYQAAISWAKKEVFDKAFANIERAIDHGLVDVNVYESEMAFEKVRDLNQWKGLMDRMRTAGEVPRNVTIMTWMMIFGSQLLQCGIIREKPTKAKLWSAILVIMLQQPT